MQGEIEIPKIELDAFFKYQLKPSMFFFLAYAPAARKGDMNLDIRFREFSRKQNIRIEFVCVPPPTHKHTHTRL